MMVAKSGEFGIHPETDEGPEEAEEEERLGEEEEDHRRPLPGDLAGGEIRVAGIEANI
jgi:hypothetical protein